MLFPSRCQAVKNSSNKGKDRLPGLSLELHNDSLWVFSKQGLKELK